MKTDTVYLISGVFFSLAGALLIYSSGWSFVAMALLFLGPATLLFGKLEAWGPRLKFSQEVYKKPVFMIATSLLLVATVVCIGFEVYIEDETAKQFIHYVGSLMRTLR